jgi:hypothetical protein
LCHHCLCLLFLVLMGCFSGLPHASIARASAHDIGATFRTPHMRKYMVYYELPWLLNETFGRVLWSSGGPA